MTKQFTGQDRGDRLNPGRSSRTYWVLSRLRREIERSAQVYLPGRGGTAIDYGCGNMPYKSIFQSFGLNYIGVDFEGNQYAENRLTASGGLPGGIADVEVLVSSQVLEHVVDPEYYLSEAHRVLRRDGLLFLTTHGIWQYHPDPTDYWRWTCDGLRKQIVDSGFEILDFRGVVGPAAAGIQLWQDAVSGRVPRLLRSTFYLACQQAMAICDAWTPVEKVNSDACVYLCVAAKRET